MALVIPSLNLTKYLLHIPSTINILMYPVMVMVFSNLLQHLYLHMYVWILVVDIIHNEYMVHIRYYGQVQIQSYVHYVCTLYCV